jgi:hypothetical protein
MKAITKEAPPNKTKALTQNYEVAYTDELRYGSSNDSSQ